MPTGHLAPTLAALALAAYLTIAIPLAACLGGPAFERRLAAGPSEPAAFAREAIRRHWLLAATAIGTVAWAGAPLAGVGLQAPSLDDAGFWPLSAAALALVTSWGVIFGRRSTSSSLLPAGRRPGWLFVALAMTAGCAEELLYRGFLILVLTEVAGCGWQLSALLSALAFGVAHGHQGPRAVVGAALAGWGLAELYLATHSLLAPVLAHIATGLWPLVRQKCSGVREPSMRSPSWKTVGPAVSTPSPATNSRVGAVVDAL